MSLDGGGIRGLFAAGFLARLEQYTDRPLADSFDLLVGTSTGAILALGLAAGITAADLLDFYCQEGPKIFPARRRSWLYGVRRPKHRSEPLLDALHARFGELRLNDLQAHVCIPSYELVEGWPRVYKDDHSEALDGGAANLVWKVAAASSAAPVYLPAYRIDTTDCHIDGGVWANNPSVVAIAEAIRHFGRDLTEISVLSVGTGDRTVRLTYNKARNRGLLGWSWKGRIIDLMFDAQAKAGHVLAQTLLDRDRYLRINADLGEPIQLDDYARAEPLLERGKQAASKHLQTIKRDFLAIDGAQTPTPNEQTT